MSDLFLKIINMSISASWLVLAVLMLRFVLKKAPKWVNVLLWGIVAVRLVFPFSIESALSLIPSAETISPGIMMDNAPSVQTGIPAINNVINPVISSSLAPTPGASANPLQIWIPILSIIWVIGVAALLLYTAVSYWRLRRKVSEAVILRDNIFQSENVASPFVLGIVKPKVYLPYHMDGQDLSHVVAHEQAHIRRKDHWWKPLGFFLLTIHWFNPLMWLAYVLLCRDIELACDEKVIKELGNEQRADYTQALVACSVNRRMIAACPLAFGEVGVKERVKSVMNYKKPAFWVIVVSIITCAVVAICFLTNPAAERAFPINGSNVSELDTEMVVDKITKAEGLENSSQLLVSADNFDLMFTSDFNWANDGAIRFLYGKNQKYYSAQLRMFHDDNKYFITDRSEWIEPEKIFLLSHYLDALKYMPQEEIRQLSSDADGYSVFMRHEGAPGDYERVLKYSQNGVNNNDGWYIHLEVQPLHEVEGGGYNGTGDEVIHLFYNSGDKRDDIAGKIYLYEGEGFGGSFTITLYEDGTFSYYEGMLSSYIALGSWKQDGDIITLTDDGHGGYGLVNHFKFDSETLTFVEKGSDNFVYLKVKDGEKFHCTGESFKQIHATDGAMQIMPSQKLSLNDVIMLSQKGYDLTWSDFDDYTYIETGSGMYIRVYEINEMYELWIGGGGPDSAPMYIYLALADDLDTRIDIRDGGVTEFIGADHSEVLLTKAIHEAILSENKPSKPDGLYHCASFVLLDQQELSGTPVVGSSDHTKLVTVYGLALHQGFGYSGGTFHDAAGSHIAVAITFEVVDGKYVLKEYWTPRDGTYYVQDIRDKFPDEVEDEVLDTQKYILAQKQECYDQAIRYGGVDTYSAVEHLFEVIESSPTPSSRPADYIDAHPIEYRELMYYGDYTLQYIFSKFHLEGNQTGLRGHLMRIVLDELAPEAQLRLYAETGQAYFDEWRAGALRISEQHDMEWIKENQPAIWLFLRMDGE